MGKRGVSLFGVVERFMTEVGVARDFQVEVKGWVEIIVGLAGRLMESFVGCVGAVESYWQI